MSVITPANSFFKQTLKWNCLLAKLPLQRPIAQAWLSCEILYLWALIRE